MERGCPEKSAKPLGRNAGPVSKAAPYKVAETLQVNVGRVYLAKHRISRLIKQEFLLLQTQPLQAAFDGKAPKV